MMMTKISSALALISLFTGCASGGVAQLQPDDVWVVNEAGTDIALDSLWAAHPATVLVWWDSTCPCVGRYEARVADLRDRYSPRDVTFAYVASNADDTPATIAAARSEGRVVLPVLRDPGGHLATKLGVISTPTVVIVDQRGAVRFHGWLDNERVPGDSGRQSWVAETLDGMLAGTAVVAKITRPAWGCMVTRSIGEEAKPCRTPKLVPVTTRRCGAH